MKIRTRLVITAFAALAPAWIAIIAIAVLARASDREKTANLMKEYTGCIEASLSSFFGDAIDVASYLATVQGEAMLEWNGELGGALFTKIVGLKDTVHGASLIDLDGYIYDAYKSGVAGNPWQGGRRTQNDRDPSAAPINVRDSAFFRGLVTENTAAEFKVIVSEPYIPRGTAEKSFVASAAVIHDGRAVGVVNVAQTTEELSRLYVELASDLEQNFGSNAHLFLFTEGGQLVSELRYSKEAGAYTDALAGRAEEVPLSSLEGDYSAALSAAAAASPGVITASMHGEAHFLLASKIEGTPLAVCLATSRATMLKLSRAMLIVGIALFLAVALAMLGGINIVARGMRKSIAEMQGAMRSITKDWNLTARVKVMGNDEIADIAESINQFIDAISGMMGSVSNSARGMSATGESLSETTALISLDISSIEKDIDSLNLAVDAQRASLSETASTVTQVVQNIESLSGQIEIQASAVTESVAAVHQMVASIKSISENASSASLSFGELKDAASDGRESICSVQELASKLSAQSDSLLEANKVIKAIASQTNLLAMNAAIEAVHAGEAGAGFSIVAEEIRKLSENSAAQSKTIAAGLKATIAAIDNIARATATADTAFGTVAAKIGDVTGLVSSLVSSIDNATAKQDAGGRHVLEALREIEIITAQIRDESVMMNAGSETVLKEIVKLAGVSQKVQDRSASVAKATATIDGELDEIVRDTGSNNEAIDALVGVTGRFVL